MIPISLYYSFSVSYPAACWDGLYTLQRRTAMQTAILVTRSPSVHLFVYHTLDFTTLQAIKLYGSLRTLVFFSAQRSWRNFNAFNHQRCQTVVEQAKLAIFQPLVRSVTVTLYRQKCRSVRNNLRWRPCTGGGILVNSSAVFDLESLFIILTAYFTLQLATEMWNVLQLSLLLRYV